MFDDLMRSLTKDPKFIWNLSIFLKTHLIVSRSLKEPQPVIRTFEVHFHNNATRTSSPGPGFVLEVQLRNLLTSKCDFVPCDRIVQKACFMPYHIHFKYFNLYYINYFCSRHVTAEYSRVLPNFQNCALCNWYLKDNEHNSLQWM